MRKSLRSEQCFNSSSSVPHNPAFTSQLLKIRNILARIPADFVQISGYNEVKFNCKIGQHEEFIMAIKVCHHFSPNMVNQDN